MMEQHLTEDMLQRHVMEGLPLEGAAHLHLETCMVCRRQLETYQLVLDGLAVQEKPAFDFDLAAAVMIQLPSPKPASEKALLWVLVVIVLGLAVFIGIGMQLDFSFLQSSTGPILTGLIILTVAGSLIFMLVSSWQDFHKKISLLDRKDLQHSASNPV